MTTRFPARLGAAALILALTASTAPAHPGLLGGFRPVAVERSSRALWTNPAAIGVSGRGTATLELLASDAEAFWAEGADGWQIPSDPLGASFSASTDAAAYGYQKELEDTPGVPSWTAAFGNARALGSKGRIGATVEYRGGDDSGFDGTLGVLLPVSPTVRVAAVVDHVLEKRVDGVDTPRRWQIGAALRSRRRPVYLSVDAVRSDGRDDVVWWGAGIDQFRSLSLSFARNSDGDWDAVLGFVLTNHRLGLGAAEARNGGDRPHRAYLAAEWSGPAYPGRSRGR